MYFGLIFTDLLKILILIKHSFYLKSEVFMDKRFIAEKIITLFISLIN